MNWNRGIFPSLKRRGGRAINEMNPFRNGAAGVVSSAKSFRPEQFAELTTIRASRSRFAPVCGASLALQLFIDAAATPPFQGGECAKLKVCQFIHTFIDRPYS